MLTIRGEKKVEAEQGDKKDRNHHLSERSYGVFYRVLQLPPGIDPSTVKATLSNGVRLIPPITASTSTAGTSTGTVDGRRTRSDRAAG